MSEEKNKIILSIKNLNVYFKTHGKDAHVIRGINLDIKREECFAIVGESGSGKSVFTKTFTGMLETNGKIKTGSIILNDVSIADPKEVRARFKDIHRYELLEKKLKGLSVSSLGQKRLKKMEDDHQKKLKKLQAQEALADGEKHKVLIQKKIKLRFDGTREYNSLYFADHLNKAYNAVSNNVISYQKIVDKLSKRLSNLILESHLAPDVDHFSAYKQIFFNGVVSDEKLVRAQNVYQVLSEEVQHFAESTPGQTITYKKLKRVAGTYVTHIKKVFYRSLKEYLSSVDAGPQTEESPEAEQQFLSQITDFGIQYLTLKAEVKKEILKLAVNELRRTQELEETKLEEAEKSAVQKALEPVVTDTAKLEIIQTDIRSLIKDYEEQRAKVEADIARDVSKRREVNAAQLEGSKLSADEREEIGDFRTRDVSFLCRKRRKVNELKKEREALAKAISAQVQKALDAFDRGDLAQVKHISSEIQFEYSYYGKRLDKVKNQAESNIKSIEKKIEGQPDDEVGRRRTELLKVELETVKSSLESSLSQIRADLRKALMGFSLDNNDKIHRADEEIHNTEYAVQGFKLFLRGIKQRLHFKKPMLIDLRQRGVVRGTSVNLAKFKTNRQWSMIRGSHIATIFQDPMTSLNPLLTIGSQITDVLRLHHNLTKSEAKKEAIELLKKVHIPNPEERFSDYPYQYSGGMRQRVVIAIALACRPDILICDEPTTALDVTVQAQILTLIKELQKEYHFTTIFITHDLGVVAGVADRIGVMYGGQIVEYGTDEDIFYHPAHPYTWALLSSLPQLAIANEPLTFIRGNPPVFTDEIEGDAFAPRSEYAMRIDYMKEPPMYQISETHFAKTWLLDPRAPKVKKPPLIRNLSERMKETAKSFLATSKGD